MSMKNRVDLLPVVDPGDDEGMMWGVPQKRYIIVPGNYDSSVDTINDDFDNILATCDDLETAATLAEAFSLSLINYHEFSVYDTEKEEFSDVIIGGRIPRSGV